MGINRYQVTLISALLLITPTYASATVLIRPVLMFLLQIIN